MLTSELRTRDDHLVWRWLTRIAHRPGVDKAELVSAAGANAELGDGVVEAVADRQAIAIAVLVFAADPRESDQEDDRLVVGDVVDGLERNPPIPGADHERLEGEVQSKIKVVELPLVAVLKRRRDAPLRRTRIHAAADHTRTHRNFQTTVHREFHRQWSILSDD